MDGGGRDALRAQNAMYIVVVNTSTARPVLPANTASLRAKWIAPFTNARLELFRRTLLTSSVCVGRLATGEIRFVWHSHSWFIDVHVVARCGQKLDADKRRVAQHRHVLCCFLVHWRWQ